MQAIIDQMVHRDMGSSSILIPLREIFCFDNGNAFLFLPRLFSLLFLDYLYTTWCLLLFHASLSTSSSFTDFSFFCVPSPPFYQTLFFSLLQSLRLCLFILSTSDSSLSFLPSCFPAHSLDFPFLFVVASRILDIMLISNLPLFKGKASLNQTLSNRLQVTNEVLLIATIY